MTASNRGASPEGGLYLFPTPLGLCGLAWTAHGIDRCVPPSGNDGDTEAALLAAGGGRSLVRRPPAPVSDAARRIARHLRGRPDPLSDVQLDLRCVPTFAAAVYERLRQVPPGSTVTYAELAALAGRAGGARAIGRIMGANPVPLIVPCHRVLTAGRELGGYSAPGGLRLKARLLFLEGVHLDPRFPAGMAHLRRDRALRAIIDRVGPCLLGLNRARDPYEALFQAILYQQLSGKAAGTIERRVRALTAHGRLPRPEELGALSDERLREAGVSRQKTSYLRDLAARAADGRLPLARLKRMSDEEIIAALTAVKGIGRWSAQMLLIFQLVRLDVLPVDDLGVRKGAGQAYGLERVATPAEVEELGRHWTPYRSMASWYLWRSLETGGL